jgi:uncharacterized protein (TIGR00369 family)
MSAAVDSALAFARRSPDTTHRREVVWQDPGPTARAGAEMPGLEYLRAISRGELPPPPMGVLMKLQPVELEPGLAVFEGFPGPEHTNPMGTVHGGYAATILDSAMGCAVHTTLPAGVGYGTLTLEIKLVRPITVETGAVRCEAEVLHRGRTQATVQGRLIAVESGKLLAHGTSTCAILE